MAEQAQNSLPTPPDGWVLNKSLWRGDNISGWDATGYQGERRCLLAWNPSREVTSFDERSIHGVLSLFRSCRHPHLLGVKRVLSGEGGRGVIWAECDLVASTLRQRVNAPDWPQRSLQRRYAMIAGVCRGLTALHRLGAVHSDLRPGTILIGQRGETILGPPERRAALPGGAGSEDSFRISRPHSPRYSAPEVLEGSSRPTVQSDIYSLALVAYDILTHPALAPEIYPDVFHGLDPDDVRAMAFSDDTGDRGMPPLWTRWRDFHLRGAEPGPAHQFVHSGKLPKALSALLHIMLSRSAVSRPDSMLTARRALLAATGEPIFESKALDGSGSGGKGIRPSPTQVSPAPSVQSGGPGPSPALPRPSTGAFSPAAIRINLPPGASAPPNPAQPPAAGAEPGPRRWRVAQTPGQPGQPQAQGGHPASGHQTAPVPAVGSQPSAPPAAGPATGSYDFGSPGRNTGSFLGKVVASLPPSEDTLKEKPPSRAPAE